MSLPRSLLSAILSDSRMSNELTPAVRLYSARHVALATFLGTPLAGCILLALNYRRLEARTGMWHSLIWGSIGTLGLLVFGIFAGQRIPPYIFPLLFTMLMYSLAGLLQGQRFGQHLSSGGAKASAWRAAGIGVLCLIGILVLLLIVAFIVPEDWIPE
jgi:hypothetical protein